MTAESETPKQEALASQTPVTQAASAQPVKAQAQPQQSPPQEEKQTNCLGCNKPLKKEKRYYRNGKLYCNKRCWRKAVTSKDKEEGAATTAKATEKAKAK